MAAKDGLFWRAARMAEIIGPTVAGLPVRMMSPPAVMKRVARLPTPGSVDSFNLASSVAVMLTLLTEAARAAPAPRASAASRLRLRDTFEDALARRGFYKGRGTASFRPRLEEFLGKMDFSDRDVEVFRDMVIALAGDRDRS